MSKNPRGRKLALTTDYPQRNVKSAKQELKKTISNETYEFKEETSNELLSHILDNINSNSLNIFYPDSNCEFKKKIDSLNLKFYLETEKYLSNKNKSQRCQISLFIILFKQINIYIEEIERLNLIIIKGKYDPKKIIKRTDEIIKKQNEFLTKEKLIKTLKESKSNMESKLLESIINEDKLKKEIQCLKKENAIFKKQLSLKDTNNKKIKNNYIKKENSKYLLHKLTHPTFHSSTLNNLMHEDTENGAYTAKEKNNNYYSLGFDNGENSKKRNNSDNKTIILNNSFKKIEKIKPINFNYGSMTKGGKLLLKNCQKVKGNSNNNSITNNISHILKNNTSIINSNYFNKKKTIHIKFNKGYYNNYNNNSQSNTQSINISDSKSSNINFGSSRPIKTEYILSEIDDYKKAFQYENNSDNKKKKEKKVIFYNSKGKEKKYINLIEKDNVVNKKNKDNKISTSSKQIANVIGKNINEYKKKPKINI